MRIYYEIPEKHQIIFRAIAKRFKLKIFHCGYFVMNHTEDVYFQIGPKRKRQFDRFKKNLLKIKELSKIKGS